MSSNAKRSSTGVIEIDKMSVLVNRASVGVVTTAILVIVTMTAVDRKALDASLHSAVESYFFAAALASGGILLDSLIDSIVVTDRQSSRVHWYNGLLTLANRFWMAGAVLSWIAGTSALAEHFGIGHVSQIWLLGFVGAPIGISIVAALMHSMFCLIERHARPRSAINVNRARRSRR